MVGSWACKASFSLSLVNIMYLKRQSQYKHFFSSLHSISSFFCAWKSVILAKKCNGANSGESTTKPYSKNLTKNTIIFFFSLNCTFYSKHHPKQNRINPLCDSMSEHVLFCLLSFEFNRFSFCWFSLSLSAYFVQRFFFSFLRIFLNPRDI